MRRSLLIGISAIAALVIVAVVVGILLNNARQTGKLTGQTHPTACGELAYAAGHLMTQTSTAQSAATCYTNAVSACHAATLNATVMGVDTGETYSFAVSNECQPALTRTLSGVSVKSTTKTATCQSVTATSGALDFTGCGSFGDIAIPITSGAAWPN